MAYLHDSPQYPLQRDGNICGVVSICMLALASLKPIDFDNYLSKKTQTWYLRNPTRYNKYLRSVVMTWISEEMIDVNNILPTISDEEE